MTADFTPDQVAARLAAAHAALARARDAADVLTCVARCVEPYGPAHVDLRYLYLDERGQPIEMQPLAVWQDGALAPGHPLLASRLSTLTSVFTQLWVATPRQAFAVHDLHTDPRCDDFIRTALGPHRGIVVLPLYSAHPDAWQGVMVLRWHAPHTPDPDELRVYHTLLHSVAAIVASARSTLAFEAALAEARALYRVSARIVEAASPADLLAVITDLALTAGAAQGTLLLVDGDDLVLAASHPHEQRLTPGQRHKLADLPAWDVWQRDPDAPVTLDDLTSADLVDPASLALHAATGIHAVLLLPLRWQGRAIAYVHLGWQEPHRFSDAERRLFRGLARQAAAVLDNRLLWDRTQRAIHDNRGQQHTLETLLDNLPIGITVLDASGTRVRINRAGLAIHELPPDALQRPDPPEMRTYHLGTDRRVAHHERLSIRSMVTGELLRGDLEVERRDGTRIIVSGTAAPTRDDDGRVNGCVLLYQDISDRVAVTRDQSRIQDAILAAQAAALAERATPVIPLTDEILVMPIVGTVDPERGRQIQAALIDLGGRTGVRAAILELTGVPTLDEHGARALVDAARGLRLRGVLPILTGMRPDVAWTLVALDIDLSALCVETDLQSALARIRRT